MSRVTRVDIPDEKPGKARPPAAPVAAPEVQAASAVPPPAPEDATRDAAGKLLVYRPELTDEGTALVADIRGKTYLVKHLSVLDRLRLSRLMGGIDSANEGVMIPYMCAAAVVQINGTPADSVTSVRDLDFMLQTLGDPGTTAVALAAAFLMAKANSAEGIIDSAKK